MAVRVELYLKLEGLEVDISNKVASEWKYEAGISDEVASERKYEVGVSNKVSSEWKYEVGVSNKVASEWKYMVGVSNKVASEWRYKVGVSNKVASEWKYRVGVSNKVASEWKYEAGVSNKVAGEWKYKAGVSNKVDSEWKYKVGVSNKVTSERKYEKGVSNKVSSEWKYEVGVSNKVASEWKYEVGVSNKVASEWKYEVGVSNKVASEWRYKVGVSNKVASVWKYKAGASNKVASERKYEKGVSNKVASEWRYKVGVSNKVASEWKYKVGVSNKVTMTCLASYVPHRYHFVKQYKSWADALSYCRDNYTDLATIYNAEDLDAAKAVSPSNAGNLAWIGLKAGDGQKWTWSSEDGTSFTAGQSYINWHSGEPNNGLQSNSCVYMQGDGTWADDHCMSMYSFVCYTGQRASATKLVLVTEQKEFPDAQNHCRKQYTSLSSVRSQSENQNVQQTAKGNPVWIGLFRSSWEWSSLANSIYRKWRDGQPDDGFGNENCVTMFITGPNIGTWDDSPCHSTYPFICYENKLILIQQNLTWREALRYCRDNHVDLVSVHSEEIQFWVMEVAQKASTEHVWLGLRHTCAQGFWYWLNVSPICYQNWAPDNGTGGEDCSSGERSGAVQSRGEQQWVSLPENQKLNFICIAYEETLAVAMSNEILTVHSLLDVKCLWVCTKLTVMTTFLNTMSPSSKTAVVSYQTVME
ncbi:hypothetical protein NFI96_004271 [Prochilodus magdalenae]|nr:hypothetical protein NFI96_004271 [Prochilodus magdalenae]